MAKENEIVSQINLAIKAALTHEKFSGAQLVGITQLVPKNPASNMPCLVDNDGECTWIDIDDTKPLQVYHRNNGGVPPPKDDDDNFPNGVITRQVTNMSLFAIAQRKAIKMTVEDLFTLIQNALPSSLDNTVITKLKLKSCLLTFQSADVNALNILKREQPNKTLDPQVIMFELKYQIECTFGKDCINTICCN